MTFDISGALVGTSMGLFLLGFVAVIVVNVLEKLEVNMTWIPVGLYSAAIAALIVPIVYYAVEFPDAYEKSIFEKFSSHFVAKACADYPADLDSTPCDIFSGSSSVDVTGETTSLNWGSAGWVLSILTVFLDCINLLQAIRGRRRNYIVPNY